MDEMEERSKFFKHVLDGITRSAHNSERDTGTITTRHQYDPSADRVANFMGTFGVSLQQVIDALPEGTTPADVLVGLTSFTYDSTPTDEQRHEYAKREADKKARAEKYQREWYEKLKEKYGD